MTDTPEDDFARAFAALPKHEREMVREDAFLFGCAFIRDDDGERHRVHPLDIGDEMHGPGRKVFRAWMK